jgi:hypothetical protein
MLHDDAMEGAIIKALYDGLLPGEELYTEDEATTYSMIDVLRPQL